MPTKKNLILISVGGISIGMDRKSELIHDIHAGQLVHVYR